MIRRFNPDNHEDMVQWDRFVHSRPESLPYHHSNWLLTFRDTYRYAPLLFVDQDDSMGIRAVAPFFSVRRPLAAQRLVCLPFSDNCGPLSSDSDTMQALLNYVVGTCASRKLQVEIRQQVNHDQFITQSRFTHHVLHLSSDPDDVRRSIDKRTIQYSIRKAERAGVIIVQDNTRKGIEEFRRLNLLTRKKHGLPPQPARFFDLFYENMVQTGKAEILLAHSDGLAIAGGVFMRHNSTVHFKYGASDERFISGKTPNHLLTWTAIEKSCREGYAYFDFGRTERANEGLARYKEMWGAVPHDLAYSYYPSVGGIAGNWEGRLPYRIATSIMKKLPDRMLQKIGDSIYRYTG